MLQLTSLYICYWKIAKLAFLEIDIFFFFFFVKITFILWYHGDIDNWFIWRENILQSSQPLLAHQHLWIHWIRLFLIPSLVLKFWLERKITNRNV